MSLNLYTVNGGTYQLDAIDAARLHAVPVEKAAADITIGTVESEKPAPANKARRPRNKANAGSEE